MAVSAGPHKDITSLLDDPKEIGEAVKSATEFYDKFISLLDINGLNKEYTNRESFGKAEGSESEYKSENMQYFIDLVDRYITGGPSKSERRRDMEVFADEMQRPFSEVEAVLNYLGLEI